MKYTRAKVSFVIEGDKLEPKKISHELGLMPSESWQKGDVFKKSRKRKTGVWKLSIDYEETLDVSLQINKIYYQMRGKEEALQMIKQNIGGIVVLSVVIEVENKQMPGIVIEEKISGFMTTVGGDVDIDVYLMS